MSDYYLRLKRSTECKAIFVLWLGMALFANKDAQAQSYGGTVTFGNANQYSFDYTIDCNAPPTSANLIVNFTTSPPTGLVPQLHLGGGVFVSMAGSNPYTYNLTGLVDCEYSFMFWMAYQGGGLYQSPTPVTPGVPLPIELAAFKVSRHDAHTASCEWTSFSELNSDYYRIERSTDALQWVSVGQVQAAGYSSSPREYRFLDSTVSLEMAQTQTFYYRLNMVDLDGSFEYSPIRSVQFEVDKDQILSIYPNPVRDNLMLDLTGFESGALNIQLVIYDLSGRVLNKREIQGGQRLTVDVGHLPSADYHLTLTQGGQRISQSRFLKVD